LLLEQLAHQPERRGGFLRTHRGTAVSASRLSPWPQTPVTGGALRR
jgi:hypothetical protein